MSEVETLPVTEFSVVPESRAEALATFYDAVLEEEKGYFEALEPREYARHEAEFGIAFDHLHNVVRWLVGEQPQFDEKWFIGTKTFEGSGSPCHALPWITELSFAWGLDSQVGDFIKQLYKNECAANLDGRIIEKIYQAEPLLQMLDECRSKGAGDTHVVDAPMLELQKQALRQDIIATHGADPMSVEMVDPARQAYNKKLTWLEINPPQKKLPANSEKAKEDAIVNALLDKYTKQPVAVSRGGELERIDGKPRSFNIIKSREWVGLDIFPVASPVNGFVLDAVRFAVDSGYGGGSPLAKDSLCIHDIGLYALIDAKLALMDDVSREEISRFLLSLRSYGRYYSNGGMGGSINGGLLHGSPNETAMKQEDLSGRNIIVADHDGGEVMAGRLLLAQATEEIDFRPTVLDATSDDVVTMDLLVGARHFSVPGFKSYGSGSETYLLPSERDPYELPDYRVTSERISQIAKLLDIGRLTVAANVLDDYVRDGAPMRLDTLVEILRHSTTYDGGIGWYGPSDGFKLEDANKYGVAKEGVLHGDCKISAASLRTVLYLCGMQEPQIIHGYMLSGNDASLPGHVQVAFRVPGGDDLYVADSTGNGIFSGQKKRELDRILQEKPTREAIDIGSPINGVDKEEKTKDILMLCKEAADEVVDVAYLVRPLSGSPDRESKFKSLVTLPDEHILRKAFELLNPYDVINQAASMVGKIEDFMQTYTELRDVMEQGSLTPAQSRAFETLTSGDISVIDSVLRTLKQTHIKMLKV